MTITIAHVLRLLRQDEEPERVLELVAVKPEEWARVHASYPYP